jgi:para-aminobenzoate synthetase component 1
VRQSYKFHINKPSDLSKLLLSKSKEIDYISILDSNRHIAHTSLPDEYVNYDLLAGVDALEILEVNIDAFNSLRAFHLQHQDWLFGYLSYDMKNEVERLNSKNHDGIKAASLSFFIPKYVLLLKGNELAIYTYETKENCEQFLVKLEINSEEQTSSINLQRRESKDVYLQKIVEIKKHIQRGDIYEMNYCQEFFAKEIDLNPIAIFQELKKNTITPFSSFLKLDHIYAMCASPERFIRKSGNHLISQPIKGTRKRGANKEQDSILIKELTDSEKDITENIMITDLVRNDLSITATKGSVKVKELCGVYTFEKVHQMITTITSEVDEKVHFSTILKSIFPMGSMTGSPKLKAMELIEEFESFKRGIFSGAIGYITPKGDFDFNVVIRTILYNASTKYLSVGVGGAITIKSDAEEEYEECLVKVKPIFEVLNFQLDEK